MFLTLLYYAAGHSLSYCLHALCCRSLIFLMLACVLNAPRPPRCGCCLRLTGWQHPHLSLHRLFLPRLSLPRRRRCRPPRHYRHPRHSRHPRHPRHPRHLRHPRHPRHLGHPRHPHRHQRPRRIEQHGLQREQLSATGFVDSNSSSSRNWCSGSSRRIWSGGCGIISRVQDERASRWGLASSVQAHSDRLAEPRRMRPIVKLLRWRVDRLGTKRNPAARRRRQVQSSITIRPR